MRRLLIRLHRWLHKTDVQERLDFWTATGTFESDVTYDPPFYAWGE